MNRIFQPCAEAILFRLSNAAERYQTNKQGFKVVYEQSRTKYFNTLLDAFLFYLTLDDEAHLVDINTGDLIESKIKLFLN